MIIYRKNLIVEKAISTITMNASPNPKRPSSFFYDSMKKNKEDDDLSSSEEGDEIRSRS
jgi:hypothetical protein